MASAEPCEELAHLPTSFGRPEAKMRRDDLERFPSAHDIDIDRSTRLMARDTEVHQPKLSQFARRQYPVTARAGAVQHGAGDRRHVQSVREPLQRLFAFDFLKSDEIGLQFLQDRKNPFAAIPSIPPDTPMHIIGGHRETHGRYEKE